jgi:hypothetical protein
MVRLSRDELHGDEKTQPAENYGQYLTWVLPETNFEGDAPQTLRNVQKA